MSLVDQAERRVALAGEIGRRPTGWIATAAVAEEISDQSGSLLGLPVAIGEPRSEWGLQLVVEPA